MFCRTVGGNNSHGRCPVLRMPILSSTSFKCLKSHSYNLICLSSTLCTYKFNLCINIILPVTSGVMCATCNVYKSWLIRSFSSCIVIFCKPFTVLTMSCSCATLYFPYKRKSIFKLLQRIPCQ